ncbi:hypothetical protein [Acidisphaera sp. S103]|uniref:hypothetical protein n=1 Tax=Acidisphaera sp. S103 TaxID=1747223 RepID=UPI00131E5956|nr:hypothetical protein [Acidisphaera sp. S103]
MSDIVTDFAREADEDLEEDAMKAGFTRIFVGAGATPSMQGIAGGYVAKLAH